uniref:Uncharacterized protein n=1 Tax=Candidatus Kentrum sp. LPFa TaxID=2126335 RepID=A0A450X8X4_9GAMM|nr:MAG: hypothetical protein BECKLPF1236B_GA0070989_15161 [Candidatus Kentron sp. LPFa]
MRLSYYETTAPIRSRRVDRYAGTFFIRWGDETLNMIVKINHQPFCSGDTAKHP